MLLFELFDDELDTRENENGGDVMNGLRQSIMDILMPLAVRGVPFVTVDSIIDQLTSLRSGMSIDRGLVLQVLDPEEVKMVNKIEGDRIYFSVPKDDERKTNKDQQEKDADHVSKQASKQAQQNVKQ